jgi:hypothetical protein
MKPKKKTKVRKLKAWAILLDGQLAHYQDETHVTFARTKKEAWRYLENRNGYEVVPCVITY